MKRTAVFLLAALSVLAFILVPTSEADGNSVTLADGTHYEYTTYGSDSATYRASIEKVETALDGVYVSTTLEGYNVKTLSDGAMSNLDIRFAVIPERVEEIGEGMFDGCDRLEVLYFMGDRPSMPEDTIPDGVEVRAMPGSSGWGPEVIPIDTASDYRDGCRVSFAIIEDEAMVVETVPDSQGRVRIMSDAGGFPVTSVGPYSIGDDENPAAGITSVEIPEGVKVLRERAFFKSPDLKTVVMPDSLEVIMDEVFRACEKLETADIPGNVRYIGFEGFRNCSSIPEITIPDSVKFMGEGALKLCYGAQKVTVGTGITDISPWTFCYMDAVKEIVFEGQVRDVGSFAFYKCKSLESIAFPDSTLSLGTNAFEECVSLRSADLGDSMRDIGAYAFSKCEVLDGMTVPASVETLGKKAMADCYGMKDVYFQGPMPEMGENVFHNNKTAVHVTQENSDSWKDFDGNLVVDGGSGGSDGSSAPYILGLVLIIVLVLCIGGIVYLKKRKV